jgi:hypothetical protein
MPNPDLDELRRILGIQGVPQAIVRLLDSEVERVSRIVGYVEPVREVEEWES